MPQLYQKEPIEFTTFEDLKKYKQNQFILFKCQECGCESKKYRCNIKDQLICGKCMTKKTMSKIDWSERNKKSQKTKLERYGDAFYTNKEAIKKSLKNKTEEERLLIREKANTTNKERYGMHPACRKEQKERTKQTCLERYGTISPFQCDEVKEKQKKTCLKKYGVENVFSSDVIKEKIKNTNIEKYGTENPRKNSLIDKKIKDTCIYKYGVEHPWSNHDVRVKCQQNYTYCGVNFDSSWELYYYIYLLDNKIDFIYQPNIFIVYGDDKKYFPDFKVCNDLVEIKGEQFFEGDKMINPYDRTQDYLYEEKHKCMIDNGVKILRLVDMLDIFDYVDKKYTNDFVKLFKNKIEFPYVNEDFSDKSDDGIIRHFHKSIYHANRKGFKSPYDAWNDKDLILKSALNRLKYVNKCRPTDIIYGFNVAKIAPKVSVFKSNLAETLIGKYLYDCNTIFDPFSGFSGRLIGAIKNNKKYIGSDLEQIHVDESNNIIDYFNAHDTCSITQKNIFDYEKICVESLFTCPPYEDIEEWTKQTDEKNIKTCDEWIDVCLEKFTAKKYLFVVDKTEKYKQNIVDTIKNKSHFGENNEYVILIEHEC